MAKPVSSRQPSARESVAAAIVCLVLGVVLAWLLHVQARFSPAVTVALSAAQAATAGRTAAPAPTAADLFASWPAGLRTMSAAEVFSPATLSDKIDGKAELYLSAGFVAMRCQRVELAAAPDAWFEAFIYDMGKPENAFAVYSSQKRTATHEAGVGDYGYVAGNQLCLVHGQYYLELIATEEREPVLRAATELARAFVTATPVARHADVAKDEALFPTEGLVAGSMMLLSADVFGFDQLTNTYVARYREGPDDITLFLCRRASPAEAGKLAAALRDFFVKDCGGKEAPAPAAPRGAVIIDSGGAFDGVFAAGTLVAGVHQAPNHEATARWMLRLSERLPSAAP
jgi:hypothetical protein